MTKGLLLAFEGLDGCGKTSTINKLIDDLGDQAVTYHFPSKSARDAGLHPDLRRRARIGLFLGDMADYALTIERDLHDGKVVLLDRWWWSTVAYNSESHWFEKQHIERLVRVHGLPEPDVWIRLTAPLAVLRKRMEGEDLFERRSDEWFTRVWMRYEELARLSKTSNYLFSTTGDQEEIVTAIKALITSHSLLKDKPHPLIDVKEGWYA